MTDDEIIAVVQAHKEGKQIQYRYHGEADWHNTDKATWNFYSYDYRVKPEPRKPREWIIKIDEYGSHAGFIVPVKQSRLTTKYEEVHVREVIEE